MSLSKLTINALHINLARLPYFAQQNSKSTLQLFRNGIGISKNAPKSIPLKNLSFIQIKNKSNIKLIDKRFKNLVSRENFSSEVNKSNLGEKTEAAKKSIFKRFKDAYKQHGKVLIYVHVATSISWVLSFFALSHSGYDITQLLNLFETIHIMSNETKESIVKIIEDFNMEKFLKKLHFDYVLSENAIESASKTITGNTLKHILTAVMMYKILAPLRYVVTLTVTKTVINLFKNKGIIPKQPPPGYSIKEMYVEKKFIYQKRLANQKDRYIKSKQLLRQKLEMEKRKMKKRF